MSDQPRSSSNKWSLPQLKKLREAHKLLTELEWGSHMRQTICEQWANSARPGEAERLRIKLDLVYDSLEELKRAAE